jgi:hypothetical protein
LSGEKEKIRGGKSANVLNIEVKLKKESYEY